MSRWFERDSIEPVGVMPKVWTLFQLQQDHKYCTYCGYLMEIKVVEVWVSKPYNPVTGEKTVPKHSYWRCSKVGGLCYDSEQHDQFDIKG